MGTLPEPVLLARQLERAALLDPRRRPWPLPGRPAVDLTLERWVWVARKALALIELDRRAAAAAESGVPAIDPAGIDPVAVRAFAEVEPPRTRRTDPD